MTRLRIAYAGDRWISVSVLTYLLEHEFEPLALLVSSPPNASHANDLMALCPHLDQDHILAGKAFREPHGCDLLLGLDLDFVVCVHFPYIVPKGVLELPRYGVLNLHPAYLPYNRGWHTPTWAILENTPYGATLHFMDEGVDTGDIVHQKRLRVSPGDTANSLYQRVLHLELEVFKEAWPSIVAGTYERRAQHALEGTCHRRDDLFSPAIQRIDLNTMVCAGDLIRRLRALTTNRPDEAAYFEANGQRFQIRLHIEEIVQNEDNRCY